MLDKSYGEAKARGHVFPSDIPKFKQQGVKLLLVQASMSQRTQDECKKAGIIAFHELDPECVAEALEKLSESENREKE